MSLIPITMEDGTITTSYVRTGANAIIRTPLEMLVTFSCDNWSLLTGIASELYISGADLSDRFLGGPLFSLTFARHIDSWCEGWNLVLFLIGIKLIASSDQLRSPQHSGDPTR